MTRKKSESLIPPVPPKVDYIFEPKQGITLMDLVEIFGILDIVVHNEHTLNRLSASAKRHWRKAS